MKTRADYRAKIEEERKKFTILERKFDANPNTRTATNLSNQREYIKRLEIEMIQIPMTMEERYEKHREESDFVRHLLGVLS